MAYSPLLIFNKTTYMGSRQASNLSAIMKPYRHQT